MSTSLSPGHIPDMPTHTDFPRPDDPDEEPTPRPLGSEPIDVWIHTALNTTGETSAVDAAARYTVARHINHQRALGVDVRDIVEGLRDALNSLPALPTGWYLAGYLTPDEEAALADGRGDEVIA